MALATAAATSAAATAAQYSIEVKICGILLVLPFTHLSTVDDVAQAAYAEYQQLNPRAPPIKLLCVRDVNGRILSTKLNIIKHQIEPFLDIQAEEWTQADILPNPQTLDGEYRKWQYWTARQVYESMSETLRDAQPISYSSVGDNNNDDVDDAAAAAERQEGARWISLLDELCVSPDDKVQGMCVKALHTLRQKSQNEQHVRYASAQLVRFLAASNSAGGTAHVNIALSVMAAFQSNATGLLPLSPFHAEELLMLTASVSLDNLIERFPAHHAALVKSYNKMACANYQPNSHPAVMDGGQAAANEAASVLTEGLDEEKREEMQSVANKLVLPLAPLQVSDRTSAAIRSAFETRLDRDAPLHSPMRGGIPSLGNAGAGGGSSSGGGGGVAGGDRQGTMSLARLLSLLAAEEQSMRTFALDKLHITLTQLATPPVPEPAPAAPTQTAITSARHSSSSSISAAAAASVPKQAANTVIPLSERFAKTAEDVEHLALALFQIIQDSLARPSQASSDNAPVGSPKRLFPKIDHISSSGGNFVTPTATRLVQAAIESPDSDVATLRTALSCLMIAATATAPQFRQLATARGGYRLNPVPSVPAAAPVAAVGHSKGAAVQAPAPSSSSSVAAAPMSRPQNTWMPLIARAGRRWAKLLLTLAHLYDESLAEPFALLAQEVVKAAGGWDSAGTKLDYASMTLFLAIKPTHELVIENDGWGEVYGRNYRLGLALDWSAIESGRQTQERDAELAALGNRRKEKGRARVVELSKSLDLDHPPRLLKHAHAEEGFGENMVAGLVPPLQLPSSSSSSSYTKDASTNVNLERQGQAGQQRHRDEIPSFAAALRRENWDMLMRLWAIASGPVPNPNTTSASRKHVSTYLDNCISYADSGALYADADAASDAGVGGSADDGRSYGLGQISRAHRLLAMLTLANVSTLKDVQAIMERISVLAKLLVFLASDQVVLPKAPAPPAPAPQAPSSSSSSTSRRTPKPSPRPDRPETSIEPSSNAHTTADPSSLTPTLVVLDMPLIRAASKCVFNLTSALKRSQQKGIHEILCDLCIGGAEEQGGKPWRALAQADDMLMFYWTSLELTVKLDAKEKIQIVAELDEAKLRRDYQDTDQTESSASQESVGHAGHTGHAGLVAESIVPSAAVPSAPLTSRAAANAVPTAPTAPLTSRASARAAAAAAAASAAPSAGPPLSSRGPK